MKVQILKFMAAADIKATAYPGVTQEEARTELRRIPGYNALPTVRGDGRPGIANQTSLRLQITAGYDPILVELV